ncbi:MAG TPA: 30S ribosomal protein S7 [Candidatus Nitrosocosmicus sp.]|jgi:small subunit ribosomal protein S7|uniref:30S ribosomal protein S7 n=1 Tax=Candidatus Nitrosocosmicus agrestis TaxID=2563600 RepID=UPI00122E0321|nr:30S ribosomal protein S7 [Candidatus Nitrosocosmicus sp. SS]KAA2281967.1 30S ribosomal protein S7 [Candidatus Nitrosocosmicus sp. SS]KAF0869872.1 30S ribosomal protein S7 [Candidatus Nitrosocosmicus sp. SS]MDR4490664.1 30S ribosomal protein S7 [Candidatus Nitrosocosmicus sp.]HET6590767.1 30S ribosomal protein S7 [Candidatus Nitrosocosmicus sp.]
MSGKEQVNLLLFSKWDTTNIEIIDPGLKNVIHLSPSMKIPITFGRHEHQRLKKAEVNIIERLANKLMHFGKRYAKNTGRMGGKKARVMNVVKTSLDIIFLETGKNPVELLVRAIENAAPNEDTTRIVYGGVVYHVSVDVAPLRRIDLALRFIAEGVRESTYSSPQTMEEVLAKEILLASESDMNSYAIKKKNEQERIAMSSR